MTVSNSLPGVALGIDFGLKRIGLARSNPERTVAVNWMTLENNRESVSTIANLCSEYQITAIFMGDPKHLNGNPSAMQTKVHEFATRLSQVSGIECQWVDERLSSLEATRNLQDAGVRGRRLKGKVDMESARIILVSALKL
jgi:putative Holliday junction resolvase